MSDKKAIDNSAWREPQDEIGKRAWALAQAIRFAANRTMWRQDRHERISKEEMDRQQAFLVEVARLCKEHMTHADQTIDQLVKNLSDIARTQPVTYFVRKP